jgi:REP element-mobilizing transposase RayT
MATPRRLQVSPEATPYYHCISRCVRRAYLCGEDRLTQRRFDHRKQWLVERLQELTGIFAIDLCAYAVMSNHVHLVVRIDRDRPGRWSGEEVAARYGRLFGRSVAEVAGWPAPVRGRRVEQWRERLGDLSWFMRCLNEAIARRANREDGCTGRFWEGRFRSQALLDDGAVLTCMSYVDLNPIRAGIAQTLEGSAFTSIRERLLAQGPAHGGAGAPPPRAAPRLVPLQGEPAPEGQVTRGPLPIGLREYVALLESTGRGVRERGGAPELPALPAAALARVGLNPGRFVASVREFGRSFFGMVGHVHRIEVESRRRGYRRQMGRRAARRLYGRSAA